MTKDAKELKKLVEELRKEVERLKQVEAIGKYVPVPTPYPIYPWPRPWQPYPYYPYWQINTTGTVSEGANFSGSVTMKTDVPSTFTSGFLQAGE